MPQLAALGRFFQKIRLSTNQRECQMYFTDDSLLPENQAPLMIVAAPYGPLWVPQDCTPEQKLPITWEEQVQAASYVTSEVRKFG